MTVSLASICVLLVAAASPGTAAESRTWTDVQGRQTNAVFEGMEGDAVKLRLADGRSVPFPLAQLSAADQEFVRQQPAQAPPAAAATSTRLPAAQRTWPDKVDVPLSTLDRLTLVLEQPENRKYVYQTEAFELVSQDKMATSVMKEIARTFEATRRLVSSLPWGVVAAPPAPLERFQAAFYETRQDYFNNGGPQNSAGVYDSGDMIFKIPFESLGLRLRGKTWYKDASYENSTLIHEITHQMMHDYLPFLPKWIIEGSAEYVEMLPYQNGSFSVSRHKGGISDHVSEMKPHFPELDLGSIEKHLTMTREQWNAASVNGGAAQSLLYFRSVLMVYFFNHLDGDGKGTRFIRFFDAVHGEVEAYQAFFANPEVKRMPGGRFSFPASLTPPDTDPDKAPFKHLPLLIDDRSYADLATEVLDGFRKVGIRLTATP